MAIPKFHFEIAKEPSFEPPVLEARDDDKAEGQVEMADVPCMEALVSKVEGEAATEGAVKASDSEPLAFEAWEDIFTEGVNEVVKVAATEPSELVVQEALKVLISDAPMGSSSFFEIECLNFKRQKGKALNVSLKDNKDDANHDEKSSKDDEVNYMVFKTFMISGGEATSAPPE
ncbi:hypothetical protein Nepgr_017842 [Nepenthes gracilis]|uniref:Uncharacterized protein n=1 Tax=Nepenthes gracilis TaxID=150966 RepID=A0AAD3SSQ6_NEPGR|nr:hypothetical protein Nepgr_017842 [Nepenthes gracilis]